MIQDLLLAAWAGSFGGLTVLLAQAASQRRSRPAPPPANPAVEALTAALANRPDPRAPREPDVEPEYEAPRKPRLPLGI